MQKGSSFVPQRVSIHAPTRGATKIGLCTTLFFVVSIHAPTRGATALNVGRLTSNGFQSTHPHGVRRPQPVPSQTLTRFNPRTHTGCDVKNRRHQNAMLVSIHAPTRGATPSLSRYIILSTRFNPRTHTGCDKSTRVPFDNSEWFQSTHPHGVRHTFFRFAALLLMFQSTHPHGVRLYIQQMSEYQLNKVSISRS